VLGDKFLEAVLVIVNLGRELEVHLPSLSALARPGNGHSDRTGNICWLVRGWKHSRSAIVRSPNLSSGLLVRGLFVEVKKQHRGDDREASVAKQILRSCNTGSHPNKPTAGLSGTPAARPQDDTSMSFFCPCAMLRGIRRVRRTHGFPSIPSLFHLL
jgi:hypothetical protein